MCLGAWRWLALTWRAAVEEKGQPRRQAQAGQEAHGSWGESSVSGLSQLVSTTGACPLTESPGDTDRALREKGKERRRRGRYPCHSARGSPGPSPALCNLSFLETKSQSVVSRGLS